MKTIAHTLMSIALAGSALLFVPALYLRYRAAADPLGIVDGLLRLSWWLPILFFAALLIYAEGRMSRARGLFSVYLPLFLVLSLTGVGIVGWANDGNIIVDHEARRLSRAEELAESRGERVLRESDFSLVAGPAIWAHEHLPRHPFGRAPLKAGGPAD
ncbi:MAG: hypothetical protein P1V51_01775 [Deltaproteobacteria bacterium]|nr:hypothetical protein [Deltaproteobacteria bacterium]